MIFIKLGGSLITDKSKPFTMNWSALETAAKSIADVDDQVLVGHGGGSFGHFVAKEYEGFMEGFFKAREAMAKLNNIVVSSLIAKNIYAVGFPPSSFTICKGGKVEQMNSDPLRLAARNYVPVVHGDVVLDRELGYTILSTEQVFLELSRKLKPRKVLLASNSPVILDGEEVTEIADWNYRDVVGKIGGAENDVTGGMKAKVMDAARISAMTRAEVFIFDGSSPGAIKRAWKYGEGTKVRVTKAPQIDTSEPIA